MYFGNKEWQRRGKNPDYRFSLANERTFLAWIRTALAFLAGSIAIDQLTPDFALPAIRVMLAILLAIGGGAMALVALRRWAENEQAMRLEAPLPYTRLLPAVAFFLVLIALLFILFIVLY
ncbi:YidH family protein [Acerihabitans sp.]|uniref:YidH family protein n=1 Tax=Acerihabitans sp. TaxID=2811394 RepID=UPI002ED90E85